MRSVQPLTASQKGRNEQPCWKALKLPRHKTWQESLVPPSLHQSIHDVAINFLLGDYIRGSHFAYLPSLYGMDQTKGVLSPVVKAVGLACLSLHTSRPELQDEAQKLYVDAIAGTNAALQLTHTARDDDVLASILLLSLYETLSQRTKVNVDAWTAHMQGALALVALRGPCQFESQFGLELFKQIAASIRVFCVQHIIRIPQKLRELTLMAKGYSQPSDMSFEIPCIVEAFTDLRADMAQGILTEPNDITARVQDVLDLIEGFYLKLPGDWRYESFLVHSRSHEIHDGYYYQFRDPQVAQIWNTTWMAKLHLNALIFEQALRTSQLQMRGTDPLTKMTVCQKEVTEAADNICASVPHFFPPDTESCSMRTASTAAMGYFLIWPLFTAGASPLVPPSTREYIVDRLVFISEDLKLPQAHKAAEMLMQGDHEESWMHMYHSF